MPSQSLTCCSVSIWHAGDEVTRLAHFDGISPCCCTSSLCGSVHDGGVNGVSWSEDGATFATGSQVGKYNTLICLCSFPCQDSTVKLWDRRKPLLGASSCSAKLDLGLPVTCVLLADQTVHCGKIDQLEPCTTTAHIH